MIEIFARTIMSPKSTLVERKIEEMEEKEPPNNTMCKPMTPKTRKIMFPVILISL
jgi:hypothetical protein